MNKEENIAPSISKMNKINNESNYYRVGCSQGEFPVFDYYFYKYKTVPFYLKGTGNDVLNKKFYPWLKKSFSDLKLINTSSQYINKKEHIEKYTFEIPSIEIIIQLYVRESNKYVEEGDLNFHIYYKSREESEGFLNSIHKFIKHINVAQTNSISLIIQDGPLLDSTSFPIKIEDIDIELNYGKDFIPIYDKIVEKLNGKNEKGLVLLHGEPGTGKTSLLKYLCKVIKKEILFVPPSMAESIVSPGFIPFMMEHSNSILVIEDAEKILLHRDGQHGNQGVSNVLNISDGILGDCLNIQIIATFNTKLKNIDDALLRKGRLIAEHELKELPIDNCNRLLEKLGKKIRVKKPMKITDIYNIEEKEFRSQKERTSIGFNK